MTRHASRLVGSPHVRVVLVVVVVMSATLVSRGHAPDPLMGGGLWAQDQSAPYKWKSGQTPPDWMRPAIHAAAADNNASRKSKAARFSYASGANATIGYGEPTGCGASGIACMTRTVPTSWTTRYRRHGHAFDWGTLRWCQRYDGGAPDGCFDVENITLDELGHVQVLGHHVNYSSQSDYGQALVQTVSRAKPRAGWNKHAYAACDVATLQKKYDVLAWDTKISTCLDLATVLTLSPSAADGDPTFVAHLIIKDADSYGRLGGNPLARRAVTLQRKRPSATTWSNVGPMTWVSGGDYARAVELDGTEWQYRARFAAPDNEGLRADDSPAVTAQ